jgi:hypothetical protein
MIRGKYKCYSLEVKAAIIESRNPNLFPDLLIPKSTAQHWIRKGPDVNRSLTALPKASKVEGNLDALALIIKCLGEEINLSVLTESEVNRLRLALFTEDSFLKTYLGKRLQNRLKSTLSPCKKSLDGKCLKRFSSQLTQMEVATIKNLSHPQDMLICRFAHFLYWQFEKDYFFAAIIPGTSILPGINGFDLTPRKKSHCGLVDLEQKNLMKYGISIFHK